MTNNFLKETSSFRDPSGFLFFENNVLYRQINKSYEKDFHKLMTSGLYDELTSDHFLISHQDAPKITLKSPNGYKIIKPEKIDFISYPYEWSFSQFKDAALLTLEIQKIAFKYGMVLKDASAYNVQFKKNDPIFVDTLSFEEYVDGQTWDAYGQFCRHFVAPIALMTQKDIRLQQLLRVYVDGIPLDLTSKLLPMKTLTMFSLMSHIHAHSKAEKKYSNVKPSKQISMKRRSFEGLIESLSSGIKKSHLKIKETEWGDYYNDTNYSDDSFNEKKRIVKKFIELSNPKTVWDLGANTGVFSKIASETALNIISFDIDPLAIEKNYISLKQNNIENILPLLIDLANPSGGIGWNTDERKSLIDRSPVDLVLSLALIHHLVISNNVPLDRLSQFFSRLTKNLIIEFIPKEDSQISRLLATRKDIFEDYDKSHFEAEFSKKFKILNSVDIRGTLRTLYLMEKI